MGLLSGIAGFAGDLLGGWLGNEAAEDRQNSANAFSAQQYATRWQTTTNDMKAAGLNPMLAYSQGVGNPSGGAISSPGGYSGLGSSFNQGRLVDSEESRNYSSASQADAQSRLIDSTVDKVKAEIENIEANTKLTKGNTNLDVQQEILRSTAFKVYQEGARAQEQGMSEGQSRAVMQATIKRIVAETALRNFDIKAAQDLGNLGREAGQLAPIIQMIISAIRLTR